MNIHPEARTIPQIRAEVIHRQGFKMSSLRRKQQDKSFNFKIPYKSIYFLLKIHENLLFTIYSLIKQLIAQRFLEQAIEFNINKLLTYNHYNHNQIQQDLTLISRIHAIKKWLEVQALIRNVLTKIPPSQEFQNCHHGGQFGGEVLATALLTLSRI